jgi:hypothetical protein
VFRALATALLSVPVPAVRLSGEGAVRWRRNGATWWFPDRLLLKASLSKFSPNPPGILSASITQRFDGIYPDKRVTDEKRGNEPQ